MSEFKTVQDLKDHFQYHEKNKSGEDRAGTFAKVQELFAKYSDQSDKGHTFGDLRHYDYLIRKASAIGVNVEEMLRTGSKKDRKTAVLLLAQLLEDERAEEQAEKQAKKKLF